MTVLRGKLLTRANTVYTEEYCSPRAHWVRRVICVYLRSSVDYSFLCKSVPSVRTIHHFKTITMSSPKKESCIKQLFKDKNNCYSLREIATALLLAATIASWIGQQFFSKQVPEFIFYSFATLIGTGCFGYSLEKKTSIDNNPNASS